MGLDLDQDQDLVLEDDVILDWELILTHQQVSISGKADELWRCRVHCDSC